MSHCCNSLGDHLEWGFCCSIGNNLCCRKSFPGIRQYTARRKQSRNERDLTEPSRVNDLRHEYIVACLQASALLYMPSFELQLCWISYRKNPTSYQNIELSMYFIRMNRPCCAFFPSPVIPVLNGEKTAKKRRWIIKHGHPSLVMVISSTYCCVSL